MNISKKYNDKANRIVGGNFESFAVEVLKRDGWKIIDTHFTSGKHEIDIIAVKDFVVAFIEVKAEKQDHYSTALPEARIDFGKAHSLESAAKEFLNYMTSFGIDKNQLTYRFDAMSIIYNSNFKPIECTYYEDFFTSDFFSTL